VEVDEGEGKGLRVGFLYPRFPPAHDAIGEHTSLLARSLSRGCDVRVWTAAAEFDPIPGVRVERGFSVDRRGGVLEVLECLDDDPVDWLVLQYQPFSYGRWGFNPYLARLIRSLEHRSPPVRTALLVHEAYPPPVSPTLAVLGVWSLIQLATLIRRSALVLFTIDPWRRWAERRFGGTPVAHLPVGSNIPRVEITRDEARGTLGIGRGTFVIGVFGNASLTRLLPLIREASRAVHERARDLLVLYVGRDGPVVEAACDGLPFRDAGRLSPRDVSRHFAAMDLYLAPFRWGASTRRGSLMSALQHGVPTVSTRGRETDDILLRADGTALLLADHRDGAGYAAQAVRLFEDPGLRGDLSRGARRLFDDHFTWERLASRLQATLESATPSRAL
jgi:glycosyltransferase involved in cell wall biosynthesis